jgi:hypothetical protein
MMTWRQHQSLVCVIVKSQTTLWHPRCCCW